MSIAIDIATLVIVVGVAVLNALVVVRLSQIGRGQPPEFARHFIGRKAA